MISPKLSDTEFVICAPMRWVCQSQKRDPESKNQMA
jgi:hypothetical protein